MASPEELPQPPPPASRLSLRRRRHNGDDESTSPTATPRRVIVGKRRQSAPTPRYGTARATRPNRDEAVELATLRPSRTVGDVPVETAAAATGADMRHASSHVLSTTSTNLARRETFVSIWEEHVSTVVDAQDCRDYLALERTFLGYLRTSVVLAVMGVLVAQLYTLQSRDKGSHGLSYSLIGKPLAICCYGASLVTVLLGAFRLWRYQRHLLHGSALTGGFELGTIWILFLGLVATFLAFTIAID